MVVAIAVCFLFFQVDAVLELATGEQIGNDRLPNLAFASDHFSLACDFKLIPSYSIKNQEKLV
jgi:hypothetical protein